MSLSKGLKCGLMSNVIWKKVKNPFGQFFIGQSYLNILAQQGEVLVANVTFEAGCRITGIFTTLMSVVKFYF